LLYIQIKNNISNFKYKEKSSNSVQNNIEKTLPQENELKDDLQEEEFNNTVNNVFQSEENGGVIKIVKRIKERSLSFNDFLNPDNTDIQNIINQYILEFRDEIINFKENREKEIIYILKKFFNYKILLLTDINTCSSLKEYQ